MFLTTEYMLLELEYKRSKYVSENKFRCKPLLNDGQRSQTRLKVKQEIDFCAT